MGSRRRELSKLIFNNHILKFPAIHSTIPSGLLSGRNTYKCRAFGNYRFKWGWNLDMVGHILGWNGM